MNIKYVQMNINASGFGCVNTNGSINPKTGKEGGGKDYANHIFSKTRNGKLYISANSVRGHLFEAEARGLAMTSATGYAPHENTKKNTQEGKKGAIALNLKDSCLVSQRLATSHLGLMRGYMLAESNLGSIKRKSPLTVLDWVNEIGECNVKEFMTNHNAIDDDGKLAKNSIFTADTWGDTKYQGKVIISIENLQFVSLDTRLGHQSVRFLADAKKDNVRDKVDAYISDLESMLRDVAKNVGMNEENCKKVGVTYGLFVKNGVLFNHSEEGVLLNKYAIHALVLQTYMNFKKFKITKAKSFVAVDSIDVHFETEINSLSECVNLDANYVSEYESYFTQWVE